MVSFALMQIGLLVFCPKVSARRGSQGASRAAPGKSGLHARGEGERQESEEGPGSSVTTGGVLLQHLLHLDGPGPITSWQIDGETVETVSDIILGGSKITADYDFSHEI